MANLFPGRQPDLVLATVSRALRDLWLAGYIALLQTPRGWYVWFVAGGMRA